MAKKAKRKTRAIVRRVVTTARRSSAKAKEVAQKAESLMTPAAGASAVAGAAFGSVLGARIVRSGKLTPKQTGAVLVAAGTATGYAGYRYQSPILFGAGVGTGVSGVTLITTNMILEGEQRQVRNAGYLASDNDHRGFMEEPNEDELLHGS